MLDMVVHGGILVNATRREAADMGIKDGKIVLIGDMRQFPKANQYIDATGMYVLPGMIDAHAHINNALGELPSLDDYYHGSIAAAYGGTTSLVDFPFLYKGETPQAAMDRKLGEAHGQCVVDYSFHPCITQADEQSFSEVRNLMANGFPSVKMFTVYRNSLMLEKAGVLRVLQDVTKENALAMIHAECADIIEYNIEKAVAEGRTTPQDHVRARPVISETEAVNSVLALADYTQAPVIFAHMSTGRCKEQLRRAKGHLPVHVETCHHYLTLNDSVYQGDDACNYICSPPLRPVEEQCTLWDMVREGIVDIVSSDHTDYASAQKYRHKNDFPRIPNGLPTIESRGLVLYTQGVVAGKITMEKYVELTSTNAAKLIGVYPRKGLLAVGSDADIAVLDPAPQWIMSPESQHMQTDYSPFSGMTISGRIQHTIVRGNSVICNGAYTASDFRGELMKRSSYSL